MNQRDAWARMFVQALSDSHHRDWSEDFVHEAALICADVVIGFLEANQAAAKAETDASHGGYM